MPAQLSANRQGTLQRLASALTAVSARVDLYASYGLAALCAGTLNWPALWVWAALHQGGYLLSHHLIRLLNPEVNEVRKTPFRPDTQPFDRRFFFVWTRFTLLQAAVCGLDHRFGWSGPVPLSVRVLAAALNLAGMLLVTWCMAVNRHFEVTVRIQKDRDHRVCDQGPYSLVRHPGYVGFITVNAAAPFILCSWWGLLPHAGCIAAFLYRTAMEDAFLQRELDGYKQYAARVRYRLLPGIW